MIEELSIRNFALIDSITIPLDSGFTVLTGETGAGKSIIVGSLGFLMGAKADAEVIRSGCDEAGVSALVLVNEQNSDALEWLRQRDISLEDSRLVVRRSVKSNGRSSIFIHNVPVTRSELSGFMGLLFDLHGQHSHESLLRKETHRVYLDRFALLEDEAAAFNRVFIELSEKRKALDSLYRNEKDREGRLELLNYAVTEINKASIRKGEIKELEAETQRLGDFEKLSVQVNAASQALYDPDSKTSETSLLNLARIIRAALEDAAAIDNSLSSLQKRMEDLFYEAEDLAAEFRNYRDNLSYDPKRLEEAEERLSLLYKLRKKYRPSSVADAVNGMAVSEEEGILAYKNEAEAEIAALSGTEENQDILKTEISRLEKDLFSKAAMLSAKRKDGAKRLSEGITGILSSLGMPKASFSAQVRQKTRENAQDSPEAKQDGKSSGKSAPLVCGPWGADEVEFLISANSGEPLKDLARIASGGELSRVMLAIKTILCGRDIPSGGVNVAKDVKNNTGIESSAETLVFDEIDTGIGGEVALSVGEYLSRMGKVKQIFCVTHLASIAVRADNHLKVEKKTTKDSSGNERTITGVSLLCAEEKRPEIARMLAGESGAAALAHADELLAKYGNRKIAAKS